MGDYYWILIILFIVAVIVIAISIVVYKAKKWLRSFSLSAFGTNSIRQGLQTQSEQLAETPKSVSGMTKIYLPQISKDFPEFNLFEFKSKAENALKSALLAIGSQDASLVTEASPDMYEQIRLTIEDHKKQGISEKYENIKFHQTEISGYRKQNGTCVITLQSAVEYIHCGQRKQTKYDIELLYIQDAGKVMTDGKALGITCPNCGGPVSGLGNKHCEYCGSLVKEINIRVWSINRYKLC